MSDAPQTGFRIIGLRQEGFRRIKVAEIIPPRHLVKITGRNEQGKSSLMDGIAATLDGGKEFLQAVPIQQGKTKSVLQLTIGNGEKVEAIVTKTIRAREDGTFSTTLVVENGEGYRAPSPQAMIDGYFGTLTVDPSRFMRMKEEPQGEVIAKMVPGLDFAEIAAKNKSDYAKRTDVNRDAKRARAAAEAIEVPDSIDAETQPIDEAALTAELAGAAQHNTSIETRKSRRVGVQAQLDAGPGVLAELERMGNEAIQAILSRADTRSREIQAEIDRLKAQLVEVNRTSETEQAEVAAATAIKVANTRKSLEELQAALDNAPALPEPIDTEALTARITEARHTNAAISQRDRKQVYTDEAERLEAESAALTKAMDDRQKQKDDAIAAAELPVPGLSLGENAKGNPVVLLDGLPLAQASHARKLRTSARIAMAMNTKLRVLLIQEAAFLDEDSMAVLYEMAVEHDYQIFVELVDSSGNVGFVIEDGMVAGADIPEPAEATPAKLRKEKAVKGALL